VPTPSSPHASSSWTASRLLVAALILCPTAPAAFAQNAPRPIASDRLYAQPQRSDGGNLLTYLGVGVGTTRVDTDCPVAGACEDSSVGLRLYAGGTFNRYLGLEVAYANLGRPDAPGGSRRAHGLGISLVGTLPLGSIAEFNVRVGTLYSRARNSGILASTYGASAKGFGLALGAGFGLDIAANLQLRLDWDRYNLELDGRDSHVDMLAAGLRLKF